MASGPADYLNPNINQVQNAVPSDIPGSVTTLSSGDRAINLGGGMTFITNRNFETQQWRGLLTKTTNPNSIRDTGFNLGNAPPASDRFGTPIRDRNFNLGNAPPASDRFGSKEEKEEAKPTDDGDSDGPLDDAKKRSGKTEDKKYRVARKAYKRAKDANALHPMKHLGIEDLDKEGGCGGDNSDPSSLANALVPALGGLARDISTQMPAMQQLLQGLPNQVLGQFLNNLPAGLQSFLPTNILPGIMNSGPFNINGLTSLLGNGAIGSIANDALRSILPSIGLDQNAVRQLTSIPFNQLSTQLGQIIPGLNQVAAGINSVGGSNASYLASTLSTIQLAIGNANNGGIPLNPAQLNQTIAVALNAGLGQVIPTNILGLATNFAQNPVGSLVNAALGGGIPNVPILPSNLSNPAGQLLSGLSQFVPQNIAQNLLNVNQLANLLPGNLQNLIPQIAPILQNAAPNLIQQIANAAPDRIPGSTQTGGSTAGGGCKVQEPLNNGKNSKGIRDINYAQPLSSDFDLHQLTTGSAISPGSNRVHKSEGGSDVDEIIKNLSSVAVNILEPLREAFPNMSVLSGYRESGDHAKGKTVDVAWNVPPTQLMEIANWARQNLPVTVKMMQHKTNWLELKLEQSCKSNAASTSSAGGCEKGLVNRKG